MGLNNAWKKQKLCCQGVCHWSQWHKMNWMESLCHFTFLQPCINVILEDFVENTAKLIQTKPLLMKEQTAKSILCSSDTCKKSQLKSSNFSFLSNQIQKWGTDWTATKKKKSSVEINNSSNDHIFLRNLKNLEEERQPKYLHQCPNRRRRDVCENVTLQGLTKV